MDFPPHFVFRSSSLQLFLECSHLFWGGMRRHAGEEVLNGISILPGGKVTATRTGSPSPSTNAPWACEKGSGLESDRYIIWGGRGRICFTLDKCSSVRLTNNASGITGGGGGKELTSESRASKRGSYDAAEWREIKHSNEQNIITCWHQQCVLKTQLPYFTRRLYVLLEVYRRSVASGANGCKTAQRCHDCFIKILSIKRVLKLRSFIFVLLGVQGFGWN